MNFVNFRRTRTRERFLRALCILLALYGGTVAAQSQNLPLSHWAYPFLDRLQTKGLFLNEELNIRPYSRAAVAKMIIAVDKKLQRDPALLSNVETRLFEQLKGEFYEQVLRLNPKVDIQVTEYEPHVFRYETKNLLSRTDVLLSEDLKLENKRKIESGIPTSTTFLGLSFRIDLKHSMAIFAEGGSYVLSNVDSVTNTNFSRAGGLPVTEKAFVDVAITDNASTYAVFQPPWFDLELGRDLVEWGPGFRGNLILSRNSNFYQLIKLTFRYPRVKFEYLHAFLNSDSTKYLAGHRLEIRPVKNLQLALSESIIYGDRSVEPLYLNPFMPIIMAERHLGNEDNNLISFDGTWFVPRYNLKLYGELLLDDFSLAKNIFNNFVNKWGLLVGGYWVEPFGVANSALRVEIVRIQPKVYSHRKAINTYSNYGFTMGHWLGPDADSWYLGFTHLPHKNLELGFSLERRRRGENDITKGARPADDIIKFLDGVVVKNYILGLSAKWQMRRDIFLSTNLEVIRTNNLGKKQGLDQTNQRLFLSLSMNF